MTGKQIQKLRHQLDENTWQFGKRFAVSGRSVENWEQDRTRPSALVLRLMLELAGGVSGTKVKKARTK